MIEKKYEFTYQEFAGITELAEEDAWLLAEAREMTGHAYAPYSEFLVGAVARLVNGEIVAGSNQENVSFPVGICAERVLLASASTLYPRIPIHTMAISYKGDKVVSDHPISPCGMCRQSLQGYEDQVNHPIRLILGGLEGKVHIISRASLLLPLAFTGEELP